MKLSIVTVLVAATGSLLGCSSSPLEPGPLADNGAAPAILPPSHGGAGPGAASNGGAGPAQAAATPSWTAYPKGPYGTAVGATIQNLSFLGWKHPDLAGYDASKFESVRLSDFYDPDGHTGVKLLAVNASAVWCGVCRREYQEMNTNNVYATLRPLGLEVLGALFEDANSFPAQPVDAQNWAKLSTHSVKFPFVLDPGFKLGAYFDSDATPLNMLIDVRTMTIVQITMGITDPTSKYWTQVQGMLAKM
ncbi:MAG TPA: redoxin domain-containing protein [Polyangiaceae bacterium]|nr:redoxin domain-containing protein [Polyangiaceae bacterium]